MTVIKEKYTEAVNKKNNDISSFVWLFAKKGNQTQESVRLVDATPEQLQSFYKHCKAMLYNTNKKNPGKYTLLDLIREQREKCNIELFVRKIESGVLCADGKGIPRFVYCQNILDFRKRNLEYFMTHDFESSPISLISGKLPEEFKDLTIGSVMEACLNQLGTFTNRHISPKFIFSLGIHLTPKEMIEFTPKDGDTRTRMDIVKERLGVKKSLMLDITPKGLSFSEFRAITNLHIDTYDHLSTDQLTVLRDKLLLRLEFKLLSDATKWEKRLEEISKVADYKGLTLDK
jgi:hypothetical protein